MNDLAKYTILTLCMALGLMMSAWAQEEPRTARFDSNAFMIRIGTVEYTKSGHILPCFPVRAKFFHANPFVTQIRMRYPLDHRKFFLYPIGEEVHMELHENFMKQGIKSFSDFIPEDENGNQVGEMIQLIFDAPKDPKDHKCDGGFVS